MARVLTDKAIERLRATGKRQTIFDAGCRGFCVQVSPAGIKSFTVMARNPAGKQMWRQIARVGEKSLADARKLAEEGARRIKAGLVAEGDDLFPEPSVPKTFGEEVETFLTREVRGKLRSAAEVERLFDKLILPGWKTKPLSEIRRADVVSLLDKIEDERGATTADRCLAAIRRFFAWQQARDDDFISPVVRGMARTKPAEQARERILSDDEIRLLWNRSGQFADFCKLALLVPVRREKLATMRWADIDDDGIWEISTEPREKVNPRWLPLPDAATAIIQRQPKIGEKPVWVFRGRTGGPLAGFSPLKRDLDAEMVKANDGKDIPHWTIHDLRRTASSLMARAGVRPDHKERTLGHKIKGVEGVYDRHSYLDEKREALKALSEQVERILHPVPNKTSPPDAP